MPPLDDALSLLTWLIIVHRFNSNILYFITQTYFIQNAFQFNIQISTFENKSICECTK